MGENSIPRFNAVMLMCILQVINMVAVFGILGILAGKIIIVNNPPMLFIFSTLLIGINIVLIFGGKKYLHIEARYLNESDEEAKKARRSLALYIIGSILLMASVLIYLNYNQITNTGINGQLK